MSYIRIGCYSNTCKGLCGFWYWQNLQIRNITGHLLPLAWYQHEGAMPYLTLIEQHMRIFLILTWPLYHQESPSHVFFGNACLQMRHSAWHIFCVIVCQLEIQLWIIALGPTVRLLWQRYTIVIYNNFLLNNDFMALLGPINPLK